MRDTMALATNPFGPRLRLQFSDALRRRFIKDLDLNPLRLDQCPELARLFCDTILNVPDHQLRFHRLMRSRGYSFEGAGERGDDSAMVVIRGAQGTGKTTLGSWMLAEITQLQGESAFELFCVPEPNERMPPTKPEFDAAIEALLTRIKARVQAGGYIAVTIENLTRDTLDRAVELFGQLGDYTRFFVLTTHDITLLDTDERLLAGSARIEVFTLGTVSPSDAEAYVAHRITQFRDPERAEITRVSPIFPLLPGIVGQSVSRPGPDGGATPVPLRVLNSKLRQQLSDHHERLEQKGLVAVANAPAESLPDYLLREL
jgi:hypothetical protein